MLERMHITKTEVLGFYINKTAASQNYKMYSGFNAYYIVIGNSINVTLKKYHANNSPP